FGTKCPSITSRWIQSAPAASTLRISSPSREKSDASTEGAITKGRGAKGWDMGLPALQNVSERPRVTRAPVGSNATRNFSCGRKKLPVAADFAGHRRAIPTRQAFILLGFSPWHGACSVKFREVMRPLEYCHVACLRRRVVCDRPAARLDVVEAGAACRVGRSEPAQ